MSKQTLFGGQAKYWAAFEVYLYNKIHECHILPVFVSIVLEKRRESAGQGRENGKYPPFVCML